MLRLIFPILGIIFGIVFVNQDRIPQKSIIESEVKSASIVDVPESTPTNIPPSPPPSTPKPTSKPTPTPTPTVGVIHYAPTETPKPQGLKETAIYLLNQERKTRGLSSLQENSRLDMAAQNKANDLLAKNYWSHTSPEGQEFWSFIDSSGYSFAAAGENLAKGYFDAQSAVRSWMDSEGHRNNILNPDYKEVGIGTVDGNFEGFQTKLIVAHFAQPS